MLLVKFHTLIKDALQITDDEVEYWVVKAFTSKVNCKMDQLNQLVIVSGRTERVFGPAQWQALRSKLGIWRVVTMMKEEKEAKMGFKDILLGAFVQHKCQGTRGVHEHEGVRQLPRRFKPFCGLEGHKGSHTFMSLLV